MGLESRHITAALALACAALFGVAETSAVHATQPPSIVAWWVTGFHDANQVDQRLNLSGAHAKEPQKQACTNCSLDRPVVYTFRSDEILDEEVRFYPYPSPNPTKGVFNAWIRGHQDSNGIGVTPGRVKVEFRLEAEGVVLGFGSVTRDMQGNFGPELFSSSFIPQAAAMKGRLVWTVAVSNPEGTFNPGAALFGGTHDYAFGVRLPVVPSDNPAYRLGIAPRGPFPDPLVVGQNISVPIAITNRGRVAIDAFVTEPYGELVRAAWKPGPGAPGALPIRLQPGQVVSMELLVEPLEEGAGAVLVTARGQPDASAEQWNRFNVTAARPDPSHPEPGPTTDSLPSPGPSQEREGQNATGRGSATSDGLVSHRLAAQLVSGFALGVLGAVLGIVVLLHRRDGQRPRS